jgi:hypothetical protein
VQALRDVWQDMRQARRLVERRDNDAYRGTQNPPSPLTMSMPPSGDGRSAVGFGLPGRLPTAIARPDTERST